MEFPPVAVRLAARRKIAGNNVVAISDQEVAIEMGVPLRRVLEITESLSWDGVTIGEARAFCLACRFDPTDANDRNRQYDYIRQCQKRRRPPQYLLSSPLWESQFLPLINLLKFHQTSLTESEQSRSREKMCAA